MQRRPTLRSFSKSGASASRRISVASSPARPPSPVGWARFFSDLASRFTRQNALHFAKQIVPVLEWLPRYSWRESLRADLAAGFLVAVMQVPQGMAYALLAHAPPMAGVYAAFVPVLVYAVFGTSHHVSVGTFAVTCVMTGQIVRKHTHEGQYSAEEVYCGVAMLQGAMLLMLGTLRLGVLCRILSQTLVSAVTTGAAVHVFTSQLKEMLGVPIKLLPYHGSFQIFRIYRDILTGAVPVNWASFVITLCTMLGLMLYSLLPKVFRLVPAELVVIIIATAICTFVDVHKRWDVSVVGDVPTGFPPLRNPLSPWPLLGELALDSVPVAMVSFVVSLSMAYVVARGEYLVRANQELLAHGLAAISAATTSAMPPGAAISRSAVQRKVGGRTQLASVVSAMLLLIVMLGAGPLLSPLPNAVLAATLLVAIWLLFSRAWSEVPRIFVLSVWDGALWTVTFWAVVVFDTSIGLLVGLVLSGIYLLAFGTEPQVLVLGRLYDQQGKPVYVDMRTYPGAVEVAGVRVLQVRTGSALVFTSRDGLFREVRSASGVDPLLVRSLGRDADPEAGQADVSPPFRLSPDDDPVPCRLTHLVIDLNGCRISDFSSAKTLNELVEFYRSVDVAVTVVMDQPVRSVDSVLSVPAAVEIAEKMLRSASPLSRA